MEPRSEQEPTVVLITGASSGIGKACAEYLARRGYRVFGTSRKAPFPPDPAPPGSPTMLQMDVTQEESVRRGVDFILKEAGRLDVVVNNAGFGFGGAVEDTSIEEAREIFETNLFGLLRVCRAVLPAMRERGSGLIVNISSIGGVIGLPYQGLYSATKFAIEGVTEALRMEVRRFGVRVTMIEPGDTRTGFTANRRTVRAARENPAYAEDFARVMAVVEADEQGGADPEGIARALERIIRARSPKPRYRVGPFFQKLAAALKGVLPGKLFEWLLMKYYRLA